MAAKKRKKRSVAHPSKNESRAKKPLRDKRGRFVARPKPKARKPVARKPKPKARKPVARKPKPIARKQAKPITRKPKAKPRKPVARKPKPKPKAKPIARKPKAKPIAHKPKAKPITRKPKAKTRKPVARKPKPKLRQETPFRRRSRVEREIEEISAGFVFLPDIQYIRRNNTVAIEPSFFRHLPQKLFDFIQKELKKAMSRPEEESEILMANLEEKYGIPLRELYTLFHSP